MDTDSTLKLFSASSELIKENKLDEALTLLNILIDENPEIGAYWYYKAIIYIKKANKGISPEINFEEAIKYINISISLESDYERIQLKGKILVAYGHYFYDNEEYSAAISKIDEGLSLLEKNDENYLEINLALQIRAMCYHKLKKYDESLESIEKALEHYPDNEDFKRIEKFLLNSRNKAKLNEQE